MRFAEAEHATKLTVLAVKEQLPASFDALLSPYFNIIYHPNYTEAILKQCDKAQGMEILLREAGIPVLDEEQIDSLLHNGEP